MTSFIEGYPTTLDAARLLIAEVSHDLVGIQPDTGQRDKLYANAKQLRHAIILIELVASRIDEISHLT